MTKIAKKGPAFLLKTYDMVHVSIFLSRAKTLRKLSAGIIKAQGF